MHAIVAIPAKNEAERIGHCLAALSRQRDRAGCPLPPDAFSILVYANNCSDDTAVVAEACAAACAQSLVVISERPPAARDSAGWARKNALDHAAALLNGANNEDGVLLTTDADTLVSHTWVYDTLIEFEKGVDAVAGYIDVHSSEMVALGPTFLSRSRLEDRYLRHAAELYAICDPREHDPFPNHRITSGACLAVTLKAYVAAGGLPPLAVGEDRAFARALEGAGFKVRHSTEVHVSTSCRFDGRAVGGAADTMRHRHLVAEAPCGADIEPAFALARRAIAKGRLRKAWSAGSDALEKRSLCGLTGADLVAIFRESKGRGFDDFWDGVTAKSPRLRRRDELTPSQLPRQTRRLELILRELSRRDRRSDASFEHRQCG